ncbi:MAG: hypothetical protein ABIH82_01160 [Candidatus Woesearchaeota archaeon]
MGWFSKLLSFFQKRVVETKPEKSTVHLNDLGEWLEVQRHNLLSKNKLHSEIIQYTNHLKAKRWELECRIDEWQNKIPLGKSDEINHFFVKARNILDLITFSEELEISEILEVQRKIDPLLDVSINKIEESSFADDYSFLLGGDERSIDEKRVDIIVNPLLKELLELRSYNEKFGQKITATGVKTLDNLDKKRVQMEEVCQNLEKLRKKHKLMHDRLQTAEAIKEEKEAELTKLKEDPLYQEIGEMENQRSNLRKEQENLDNEIIGFFSKLKPLLLKYKENNQSNLVESYLEDPSLAFSFDENLNILHILEHLQASLQQNKIVVETEKLNNFLQMLKKARSGFLEDLHNKQLSFHQDLDGPLVPLKNRDFVMKLEESRYRVEHFSKQLDELEERKAAVEEELEELDNRKNRELTLFQDMVRIGLGKEVTVRVSN